MNAYTEKLGFPTDKFQFHDVSGDAIAPALAQCGGDFPVYNTLIRLQTLPLQRGSALDAPGLPVSLSSPRA
jgi:hypothetical protein